MNSTPTRGIALAASIVLALPSLHAQTAPDAGDLLRERQRNPTTQLPAVPPLVKPAERAPDRTGGLRLQVKAFKLTGVSLLPEAELQARLAPFVGKEAGLADLQRAADAVAEAYRERGWLVRAFLAEQDLRDGLVELTVLEGRLGAVRVDRTKPGRNISDEQVVATMTARQKVGAPVRADDIQRGISLVNSLPGVSASSLLEPGDKPGESRLVVAVADEASLSGQAQLDNAGSKASGEVRASGGLSWNSPLGIGDQVQGYASKSQDSGYASASYSAPLGSDGLRGAVNFSHLSYGYDLSGSRYTGSASVAGASLSYPLLRRAETSLGATLSHDRKSFANAVAGIGLSDKTIAVTALSLSGDAADGLLGGGRTQFGLTLSSGLLDLSGNAADLAGDQVVDGPQRHGRFSKIALSLGRLQRMTAADTLQLLLSGQRASRNLDSAEKFSAAGNGGVRAYASAEPGADDGTLLNIEWRHQFNDELTLALFHDQARVRRDHRSGVASLSPNRYSLSGSGLGLSWGGSNSLLLRVALAWRQGENPVRNAATGADSDGTRRDPRAYFSLLKTF